MPAYKGGGKTQHNTVLGHSVVTTTMATSWINFVLYCIVDVYFRETWVNLVCCVLCRRRRRQAAWMRDRAGSFGDRQPSVRFNASAAGAAPTVYLDVGSQVTAAVTPHRHQMRAARRCVAMNCTPTLVVPPTD